MKLIKESWSKVKARLLHLGERLLLLNTKYIWGKYLLVLLLAAIYAFGRGEYTLLRYIELKQREYRVNDELDELVPRFVSDSLRLENIRTNPEEIEQIARERYYMKSPGEEIYIIKSEGDRPTESR